MYYFDPQLIDCKYKSQTIGAYKWQWEHLWACIWLVMICSFRMNGFFLLFENWMSIIKSFRKGASRIFLNWLCVISSWNLVGSTRWELSCESKPCHKETTTTNFNVHDNVCLQVILAPRCVGEEKMFNKKMCDFYNNCTIFFIPICTF
jgi:hypothetical protein